MFAHIRRIAQLCLVVAIVLAPSSLRAQEEIIYSPSELDVQPRISSPDVTARLLARSYPPALQRAGITGTVQVQFVVDVDGKVESATIKVLSSTVPQLADAAKSIAEEIRFKPGMVKGKPVRVAVLLPIVYK